MMTNNVYNIDCLEYMAKLPANAFALAIADPPYGIGTGKTNKRTSTYSGAGKLRGRILNKQSDKFSKWDKTPTDDFFNELRRVSRNQIIFGGNYFPLPPTRCFICWDKVQPWENFSQVELIWTSFDYPAKLFKFDNRTGGKIHPTQKPVELYSWILQKFAQIGDTIFNPMMGSQSSRIAAYKMGFDFTGCEIDEEYFSTGCERFERECNGVVQLKTGETITQTHLNL